MTYLLIGAYILAARFLFDTRLSLMIAPLLPIRSMHSFQAQAATFSAAYGFVGAVVLSLLTLITVSELSFGLFFFFWFAVGVYKHVDLLLLKMRDTKAAMDAQRASDAEKKDGDSQ